MGHLRESVLQVVMMPHGVIGYLTLGPVVGTDGGNGGDSSFNGIIATVFSSDSLLYLRHKCHKLFENFSPAVLTDLCCDSMIKLR